jgi:hypothetical protein
MSGPNPFDDEVLQHLQTEHRAGRLVADPNADMHFERLWSVFPPGICTIAWHEVPGVRRDQGPATMCRPGSDIKPPPQQARVERFLHHFASDARLGLDRQVIVMGDALDHAFLMPFGLLLANAVLLFSFPQHCYVVPSDFSWCLSYTFEDEMYYAPAPGGGVSR